MKTLTLALHLNLALEAIRRDRVGDAAKLLDKVTRRRVDTYLAVLNYAQMVANTIDGPMRATMPEGATLVRAEVRRHPDSAAMPAEVAEADDTFAAVIASRLNDDTAGAARLLDLLDDSALARLLAHAAAVTARYVTP